jgi:uncharacterized membrane protein YkvA (DUF1232 family)
MRARHGSAARAQRAVREEEEREVRAPRTGAKRTVMYYVRQLPAYIRLLGGLLMDKRVAIFDKLLVAGAIVYIVSPIDLIPDFIPFFGEIDDLFLLVLALQHLINNAGRPRGPQPEKRVGGGGVLSSKANSPSATRDRAALGASRDCPRGLPSIWSRAYFSPWQPELDHQCGPRPRIPRGAGFRVFSIRDVGLRGCATSTR